MATNNDLKLADSEQQKNVDYMVVQAIKSLSPLNPNRPLRYYMTNEYEIKKLTHLFKQIYGVTDLSEIPESCFNKFRRDVCPLVSTHYDSDGEEQTCTDGFDHLYCDEELFLNVWCTEDQVVEFIRPDTTPALRGTGLTARHVIFQPTSDSIIVQVNTCAFILSRPTLTFEMILHGMSLLSAAYPQPLIEALLLIGGIEPNPGPLSKLLDLDPKVPDVRHNRYSTPRLLKKERKALKRDISVVAKSIDAARKAKHEQVMDIVMSNAQLGGEYTKVDVQPDCNVCGKKNCDCMIKRNPEQIATNADWARYLLGTFSTLLGLIERVMRLVQAARHPNVAQIGFSSFFGASGLMTNVDTLANNVNEAISQLPTRESIGEVVGEAVKTILDTQCGFLPVSIRVVFQSLLTLTGIFIMYQVGCITFDVLTLPLELCFKGFSQAHRLVACFRKYTADTPAPNHAQLGIESVFQDLDSWMPKSIGLLGALLSSYCLSRLPDRNNSPTQWLNRIGQFPRAAKGFMEVANWVESAFTQMITFVKINLFGHDPEAFEQGIPSIQAWLRDVETFMHKDAREAMAATEDGRNMLVRLYDRGGFLMQKYYKGLTVELKLCMTLKMRDAAKIMEQVEALYPEVKTVRTVPIALWLVGESQIGKSRLQYLIANYLAVHAGLTNFKNNMYQRCVEQVYWDGYNGQLVVIYDDFLQMKDSTGAPNLELFEFIRGIGPFPYGLHMAELGSKGSTYFTSRVIIASTNVCNPLIESITYPLAVWNRLSKFSYRITVKPEYLLKNEDGSISKRLNIPKIQAEAPMLRNKKRWEINPHIYTFTRFCPITQRVKGEVEQPIEWNEFIARVVQGMNDNKDDGLNLDSFLTDLAVQLREDLNMDVSHQRAQVGTKEVCELMRDVHAQGCAPAFDTAKLTHFQQFIEGLEEKDWSPDIVLGLDYVKLGLSLEFDALHADGKNPAQINLCGYKSEELPDAVWNVLLVKFYNDRARPRSRIDKIFDGVIKARDALIARIPIPVLELLSFMSNLFMNAVIKLQEYITKNPIISLLLTLLSAYLAKKIITRQEALPLAIPTPKPTILCPSCTNCQPSDNEYISLPTPTPSIISLESDTRNHQPRLRQRVVVKTVAQPRVIAEMGQSLSQLAVIEKVRANQWHLSAEMEDGSSYHLGMITNIKGKIFTMPAHFYTFLNDKQPLTVTMTPANNDKLRITKNYDNWISGEVIAFNDSNDPSQKPVQFPMDICVFCLDQMPRGKSILHHFASDEDLAKLYNSSFHGTLSGMDIVEDKPILTNMGGTCNIQFAEIIVNMPDSLDSFRAAFLVRYDIPTKVGDCGKILTINSDKVAGRILGFHISGSKDPGRNYSQVVSRSTIEKALTLLPNFAQINCGLRDLPPAEKPFETGLITRGQANFTIPQVSKTSIVPSALYGEFNTPLTRPARLRPWKQVVDGQIVQRDPLRETAAKQGRQCGNLPKATIEVIECSMQQLILPRRVASTEVRLLTYEESVRGIEGDPLFQPINRLTSPGYPYVLDPRKKGKGKTFWMGSMEWDFTSPQAIELRHDVDKLEEDLLTDQPHEIIWVDTLKDERRSHAKVDAGKTRLISNGPMHYNILFRKYFMGALAHIRANRIDNGVAVGINVWGPEWHALAMYLQGTSDEMIDGDMTDFSDRLMDDLTWVNFRLFNKIYETYDYDYHDDHRRVRERISLYSSN